MKGLFIKDLKLLKMQKKFYLLIIGLAVILSFSMRDISFLFGYIGIMVTLGTVGTISYDEFDNGNAFLFTLPITRKDYVLEKYAFCLLMSLLSWGATFLLAFTISYLKEFPLANVLGSISMLGVIVVFLSFMIPIQIKFGAEKSRIATIAFCILIFLAGSGIATLLKKTGIDREVILNRVIALHGVWIALLAIALVLAILLLSVKISMVILEKKEF